MYIHCETFETVEHDRQILIVGVVVYGAYEKSKKKKRVENLPLRRDDDWFQRDSQLRKHNTIRSIIFSLAGGRRGVSTEEGITAFTGKELAAPEETAVTKIRIDKKKKRNARSTSPFATQAHKVDPARSGSFRFYDETHFPLYYTLLPFLLLSLPDFFFFFLILPGHRGAIRT